MKALGIENITLKGESVEAVGKLEDLLREIPLEINTHMVVPVEAYGSPSPGVHIAVEIDGCIKNLKILDNEKISLELIEHMPAFSKDKAGETLKTVFEINGGKKGNKTMFIFSNASNR